MEISISQRNAINDLRYAAENALEMIETSGIRGGDVHDDLENALEDIGNRCWRIMETDDETRQRQDQEAA